MPKAILFDFDGVLVNTSMVWWEINKQDNPDLDFLAYQAMSNGNYLEVATQAAAAGKYMIGADANDRYAEKLTEQKVEAALVDLVKKISEGHKLFVVSSGSERIIERYLREQNIIDYFTGILGNESQRSKEIKIKNILSEHAIEPQRAVMITDTSGDIIEAKLAGVKTIAVLWGLHDSDMLSLVSPEKIVGTPRELEAAIGELLD